MPQQFDFENNEYRPIRDAEERARVRKEMAKALGKPQSEWRVIIVGNGVHLESSTHDDDVWLTMTGNFTPEQKMRVANEICEQLNAAERQHDEK